MDSVTSFEGSGHHGGDDGTSSHSMETLSTATAAADTQPVGGAGDRELEELFEGVESDHEDSTTATGSMATAAAGSERAAVQIPDLLNHPIVPKQLGFDPKRPPVAVRLPNFLAFQPKPFNEILYSEKDDLEVRRGMEAAAGASAAPTGNANAHNSVSGASGSAGQVRLGPENFVRWRYVRGEDGIVKKTADGKQMRESNARLVRWSDGSMQLYIGSEVIDVEEQPLELKHSFVYARAHETSETASAQVRITKRLRLTLPSTQSKSHRALSDAIGKKHQKDVKVKELPVTHQKLQELQLQAAQERAQLEQAQRRQKRSLETSMATDPAALNSSFIEAEDEEEATSSSSARRHLRRGGDQDDEPASLRQPSSSSRQR